MNTGKSVCETEIHVLFCQDIKKTFVNIIAYFQISYFLFVNIFMKNTTT